MAIDIRNINEITFTRSFRGYDTEEVDDFLDDIYDESIANNKEIEELKKKIAELESGSNTFEPSDTSYNVIADAQEEADRIIDSARKKAHDLIERAESMNNEKPAHAIAATTLSSDATDKLKILFDEMYKKQMAILESVDAVEEVQVKNQVVNDIPSVSFAGIVNEVPEKIPAQRDILGEINSIELGEFRTMDDKIEEKQITIQEEIKEDKNDGLAFSFAETDETPVKVKEVKSTFIENEPEDPDDIIAQILRDNNRN